MRDFRWIYIIDFMVALTAMIVALAFVFNEPINKDAGGMVFTVVSFYAVIRIM